MMGLLRGSLPLFLHPTLFQFSDFFVYFYSYSKSFLDSFLLNYDYRERKEMERTLEEAKKIDEGKVVIVTASTQGIGFGIIERLGLEGASVSSRNQMNKKKKGAWDDNNNIKGWEEKD